MSKSFLPYEYGEPGMTESEELQKHAKLIGKNPCVEVEIGKMELFPIGTGGKQDKLFTDIIRVIAEYESEEYSEIYDSRPPMAHKPAMEILKLFGDFMQNDCDDCDGSGEYFIDNKPQKCICSEPQIDPFDLGDVGSLGETASKADERYTQRQNSDHCEDCDCTWYSCLCDEDVI